MIKKQQIHNGLVLIAIGIVFLLFKLDFIDLSILWYAFRLWPVALIFIGISVMVNNQYAKMACSVGYFAFIIVSYMYFPQIFLNF